MVHVICFDDIIRSWDGDIDFSNILLDEKLFLFITLHTKLEQIQNHFFKWYFISMSMRITFTDKFYDILFIRCKLQCYSHHFIIYLS